MPFKQIPPLYSVWMSMKDRCRNPNAKAFHAYGGREISVCDRWSKSYADFAADMGERPPMTSLDRINNDLGYFKENCRWATSTEQQLNRRTARFVEIEGVQYRVHELARLAAKKADTIIERAESGLPYAEVISQEKRRVTSGFALGGAANGIRQKSKSHCPHGHSYENAIITRQGWRVCRVCFYAKENARQKAKRASKSL